MHGLFQYPAMMVPELQGTLLDDALSIDPAARRVYDPFAGSGTILLESIYRGLDFYGSDINPMATLLCSVKAEPPQYAEAFSAISAAVQDASSRNDAPIPNFPGVNKWFKPGVQEGLASLQAAIRQNSNLVLRRFMWVCLAETIRLVSNSRISTFKLHVYPPDEIARRESDAVKVFRLVAARNVRRLKEHLDRFPDPSANRQGGTVTLLTGSVSNPWIAPTGADILMTSPPYGDNKTTVPYGQHSYLQLCWIDHQDLPGVIEPELLESTLRIDSLSLGGSIRLADSYREELLAVSTSLGNFMPSVDDVPPLRKKVLSFVRDYREALADIDLRMKPGAFCFLTLGERRVGREAFPLVEITKDILCSQGHEVVTTIERAIPGSRKKMAARNSLGATIAHEWILVTQSRGRE